VVVLSAGALVVLVGALALAGWAVGAGGLSAVGGVTLKANTAVCLVLAGSALAALGAGIRRRWPVAAAAGVVLLVALATLVQETIDIDLGIDELLVRDPATRPGSHPGRMAVATAVALVLTAATTLLVALAARRRAAGAVARALAGGVTAIGVMGLLGHAFRLAFLTSWYAFGSVALPAAAAFVLLGVGLLATGRRTWPQGAVSDDRRITEAAALALVLAAGATGLVGVAALEVRARESMESHLQTLLGAHLAELTSNIELRTTRAAIVTTRPNMLRMLRRLNGNPNDLEARRIVQGVLDSFLTHDFSSLVVTGADGHEIARTEGAGNRAAVDVALLDPRAARLLWRDGLFLRHELPLGDAQGPLGAVVTEQRIPRVTAMLTENQTRFASAEFLLCAPAGGGFRCFPSRRSAAPVTVPRATAGEPRLAERAVAEGTGVSTATDYLGRRVLGAYATPPALGLVAVLKVDADELYGPVRRQLGLVLILVVAVSLGGVGLVRARVGPLAARLDERVRERTAEVDRVNARLQILHDIDRGLITAQEPVAVAEAALRPLQTLMRLPRVIVNLFDFDTGEAVWLAAAGRRRVSVNPGVRFPLALMGDLDGLRRGEVQEIDVDALPPSPAAEALLASGVHVYRVVPMISRGELIGGLSFGGGREELSTEQIDVAREVATQMAIVIAQARLHERVRRQAEELERRVEERTRALSQAEAEAARANRAKSEFLSRMSHELRTPLNGILGFAQLLEMRRLPPEQQAESVEQILVAGRHLLALIDEVLDIARIEAGRLRLSLEPVPLGESIRGAVDLLLPLARERSIEFRVEAAPDGAHVVADRQRLHQVLLNLLSNGVKYTPSGGSVTVSCAAVSTGRLALRVTDTGPGMTPDRLERLFTPFERLGAEATGVEGTGLGLTLSRHLVEAMGGALRVESTVGAGSTFSVELTVTDAPITAMSRPWPPPAPAAVPDGASAVVLYVEDNLSNLRLVERILDHRPGIKLLSAMQGRVGFELACQHQPDLILLDQHLPDLNGEAVLGLLHDDPRTREIPVVILSADANPRHVQRLRDAGARDYLTKPLDVGRFLAVLDATLRR
jgi:signal transduction histidine kinase